jgi:hypothetical protein
MRVSPLDGLQDWFCDVAVDAQGRPHVVWGEYPHYLVCYSYFDGIHWSAPVKLNDTTKVLASPYTDTRIVMDSEGYFHVVFTGASAGAAHRGFFYTRYDGSSWSEPVNVVEDTSLDVWWGNIAANSPSNVWVTYDVQVGSANFSIYATHFDGEKWSPAERVDGDTSYYDCGEWTCLDHEGNPWAVWEGLPVVSGINYRIYANHYGGTAISEGNLTTTLTPISLREVGLSRAGIVLEYGVTHPSTLRLRIIDEIGRTCKTLVLDGDCRRPGTHRVVWDGSDDNGRRVPAGVYFCCFNAGTIQATCKVVLLAR